MTHKQQAAPNDRFLDREKRRAEALRENLRKRKEQQTENAAPKPEAKPAKKDK